jgi:FAD/FMN-containing dehydrogenase
MDKLLESLAGALEGTVRTPDQFTADQSQNYGRIFQWTPRFVVYPKSDRDVIALVDFCRTNRLGLTNRGSAHSQSQLAINRDGVLVEMKSMNRIG